MDKIRLFNTLEQTTDPVKMNEGSNKPEPTEPENSKGMEYNSYPYKMDEPTTEPKPPEQGKQSRLINTAQPETNY